MLDPIALINLKEIGECFVNLPEEIFDLDYPGHYFRRIKNVRLTIPCVTGPHTTVNCTLTLLSNSVRTGNTLLNAEYKRQDNGETRFRDNVGAIQSIATSTAQNDSGTFELNFRNERYLPFEGAGAISTWRIELLTDPDLRQFDYDTITDVILHISYTTREGGAKLKEEATKALKQTIEERTLRLVEENGLLQLFSLKHQFPNKWHRFLHPATENEPQRIELQISSDRFPFMFHENEIAVDTEKFFMKLKGGEVLSLTSSTLSIDGGTAEELNFETENGMPIAKANKAFSLAQGEKKVLTLEILADTPLSSDSVEDICLVLKYGVDFQRT